VNQIFPEPLNEFVSNSQGRHVWHLNQTSLNVKVKGQGHQGQKMCCALSSPPPPLAYETYEWYTLAANNIMLQQMGPFRCCRGLTSAACLRYMFGKTSVALVCNLVWLKSVKTTVATSHN